MSRGYYKLDGKIAVPCQHVGEWAAWFGTGHRVVQQEDVGPFLVSTVFLGLDHSFGEGGPPLLFESAVFTRGMEEILGKVRHTLSDHNMERTSTWELALEAHQRAVAWAKEHANDNR